MRLLHRMFTTLLKMRLSLGGGGATSSERKGTLRGDSVRAVACAHRRYPPVSAAVAILLLAMGVSLFLGSWAGASAVSSARMSIDVDPATPGIQNVITYPAGTELIQVDVAIQDADKIGAFEFEMFFSNVLLEFRGWSAGPFLGSTGREVTCHQIISENSLRLGCTTTGPAPPEGPSGDGVLARLEFAPRFVGGSCLLLLLVETAAVFGDPLPTTSQGGCLTIAPNPK